MLPVLVVPSPRPRRHFGAAAGGVHPIIKGVSAPQLALDCRAQGPPPDPAPRPCRPAGARAVEGGRKSLRFLASFTPPAVPAPYEGQNPGQTYVVDVARLIGPTSTCRPVVVEA